MWEQLGAVDEPDHSVFWAGAVSAAERGSDVSNFTRGICAGSVPCVADSARGYDISTGLLYTWRGRFRRELPGPAFAEAVVTETPVLEIPPHLRRSGSL